MTTLVVIIARAGSKGLANKSMQMLRGKPVIAWTIEYALHIRCADAIVLTSDCPNILAVGGEHGLYCYQRPAHLAADTAAIDGAVRHGVECWETEHNRSSDIVSILYGNIPVRPVDLSDRAVQKLIETKADSVQSVCPVGKMHPLWMRKISGPRADVLEMYEPNRIYRRQDLPPVYMLDAGALAVTRSSLFTVDPAEPYAYLGRDRRAIVTAPGEVVDVDDELDITLAEVILQRRASVQTAV